jgi:hypothetical protein
MIYILISTSNKARRHTKRRERGKEDLSCYYGKRKLERYIVGAKVYTFVILAGFSREEGWHGYKVSEMVNSFGILQDDNHNQGVTFDNIFFKPKRDCSCVRRPMSKE